MNAKQALKIAEANKHRQIFDMIDERALNGYTELLNIDLSSDTIQTLRFLGYEYNPETKTLSWRSAK